jgi:hypothetical protein
MLQDFKKRWIYGLVIAKPLFTIPEGYCAGTCYHVPAVQD